MVAHTSYLVHNLFHVENYTGRHMIMSGTGTQRKEDDKLLY